MNEQKPARAIGVLIGLALIAGVMFGLPRYMVYVARLDGEAQLARARGAAEANEVLSKSIQDPKLVQYLFVKALEENKRAIYVPTEGNLPVLEATRLKK